MFYIIFSCVQIFWFLLFFILEKIYPAQRMEINRGFICYVVVLNIIFLLWLKYILYLIAVWPFDSVIDMEANNDFLLFYILFSFVNYWWHRVKHSNSLLWTRLHYLHHYPSRMNSLVAFLRHPTEVFINTILIIVISSVAFNFDEKAVFGALVIESMLEIFHHSNINFPAKLGWIRYIIQTPDMHLLHHEKGKHRSNYSPLAIYDYIFHTWKVPEKRTKIGLSERNDAFRRIFKF